MSTAGIPFNAAGQQPPPPDPSFAQSPYTAPAYTPAATPNLNVSPGLAFLLGFIPGVGAIYNGQYGKGLMHVIIVGLLISVMSSPSSSGGLEPLLGLMITGFWFYMCFEAYHTARQRQMGLPVDEFSSILPLKGSTFPFAPVLLIVLGVLFLLSNLGLLEFARLLRFWPVVLIALGAYMLYVRYAPAADQPAEKKESTL